MPVHQYTTQNPIGNQYAKNSFKIICNKYQFKNYMVVISYIFRIISYKNEVEKELPQNDIGKTRNILDCDQSNYSSRIILAHIPAKLLS